MTQYINKAALVAEIERRLRELSLLEKASYEIGLYDAYKIVLSFLNTLEVKEVDLEKEIDKWICDDAITREDCSISDVISTAKHFFELGLLKAQKGE